MNAEKFKIIISSDIDYDDLCAEIYYRGQFVAIIDQEQGDIVKCCVWSL